MNDIQIRAQRAQSVFFTKMIKVGSSIHATLFEEYSEHHEILILDYFLLPLKALW